MLQSTQSASIATCLAGRIACQTKVTFADFAGRSMDSAATSPSRRRQSASWGSRPPSPKCPYPASMNMTAFFLRTSTFIFLGAMATVASAQNYERPSVAEQPGAEQSSDWYGESTAMQPMTPRMIIQQKAQMRAHQRMARMESMKWYGFSAARPLASATPFLGVPSPRYEMPGGRPFAWYPYSGTNVVIVR